MTVTTANPSYTGSLQSGKFGPDTGMYRAFVESYGVMVRHEPDGTDHWHTREDARLAAGCRNGHVAIVGIATSNPHYHNHQPARMLEEDALRLVAKAQRRIKNLDNWCQHYSAVTAAGVAIGANDRLAVRHCAMGSIFADSEILDVSWHPAEQMAVDFLDNAALIVMDQHADCHDSNKVCDCTTGHLIANLNDCPQWGHRFVMLAYEQAKADLRDQITA